MRWKLSLALVLLLLLAIAAVGGWLRWQGIQREEKIAQELALCRNQIDMGNAPRAQQNLERILAENPRLSNADDVWAMLAESYDATSGAADKATRCWEKIRTQFAQSKHMDKALAAFARRLQAQGKLKEAREQWDIILTTYKGKPSAAGALLGKAQMLYDEEDLAGARALLTRAAAEYPDSDRKPNIEDLLGKVNLEQLYSREPMEGDQIYAIARGDKLETIGRRFKVSPDLLKRVNHIRDIRMMPVGRRIKIPKTSFSIVVDKSDNTLTLLNNAQFFKRYPVRTGKVDYLTPPGDFEIESKVVNPPWNNPEDGKHYPPLDPKNELGTRWMAFQGALGIHGTIHPETVGKYASNGCVGMFSADAEELYDLVPLGTPIKIVGKMKTSARKSD